MLPGEALTSSVCMPLSAEMATNATASGTTAAANSSTNTLLVRVQLSMLLSLRRHALVRPTVLHHVACIAPAARAVKIQVT